MGVVNGSVNIESELDDVVCSRKTIMSVVEGVSLFVISVIIMNLVRQTYYSYVRCEDFIFIWFLCTKTVKSSLTRTWLRFYFVHEVWM